MIFKERLINRLVLQLRSLTTKKCLLKPKLLPKQLIWNYVNLMFNKRCSMLLIYAITCQILLWLVAETIIVSNNCFLCQECFLSVKCCQLKSERSSLQLRSGTPLLLNLQLPNSSHSDPDYCIFFLDSGCSSSIFSCAG